MDNDAKECDYEGMINLIYKLFCDEIVYVDKYHV